MKKLLLLFIVVLPSFLNAQQTDIILKAMEDELNRNMKELHINDKEFQKPFYIAYSIYDLRSYAVASSLGALLNSSEQHSRSKDLRVLVGDYEFNDESLDNNLFSQAQPNEIDVPIDDDYFGIRRAFWVTTDEVYKNAARQYKKNAQTYDEKRKTSKDIRYRTFAEAPAVNIISEIPSWNIDKKKLEDYSRQVSAIFLEYPEMTNSAMYIFLSRTIQYHVNSEGSIVKTPKQLATMVIFGGVKSAKGEDIFDQLTFYAPTPDKFPSLEKIKAETKKFCELLNSKDTKTFDEEYSGPVLFEGRAVAEIFANSMFNFHEGLVASQNLPQENDFRQENVAGLETKIGKLVMNEKITVTAKSTMSQYNGEDVLGAYTIDNDGVRPPDELLLVEKGVLKNLLGGRSMLKIKSSNGHVSGPGVIDISFSETENTKNLKEKLIAKAKKEGLEYGIIIRNSFNARAGFANVYKVFVSDGHEELTRFAMVQPVSLKNLKKITNVSAEKLLHHLQSNNQRIASYIVPSGILLDELEIKSANIPGFKLEEFVESPLKAQK